MCTNPKAHTHFSLRTETGCILTRVFIILIQFTVTFSSLRGRRANLWFCPVRSNRERLRPSAGPWCAAGCITVRWCTCTPRPKPTYSMPTTKTAPGSAGTRAATLWTWPSLIWGPATQTATTASSWWTTRATKIYDCLERLSSSSSWLLVSCLFLCVFFLISSQRRFISFVTHRKFPKLPPTVTVKGRAETSACVTAAGGLTFKEWVWCSREATLSYTAYL